MFSFRCIRSCISWTQYTWVYCLYVRVSWIIGSECIWAATWQNQLNGCAPSEDSDQPGHATWRSIGSLAMHWAHSEDSDQTGRMPRLIWVFAWRTLILLVLSCRGSYVHIIFFFNFSYLATIGPRQANLVLIAYASSEGSGETAHACACAQSRQNLRCSLIQAVSQEEPSDRQPDPWPLWMAGHAQLNFVMTECSKTQIRLTGLNLSC